MLIDAESYGRGGGRVASGWAAITLPPGDVEDVPVGVQLMAPNEAVVLCSASHLERALRPSDRHHPGSL